MGFDASGGVGGAGAGAGAGDGDGAGVAAGVMVAAGAAAGAPPGDAAGLSAGTSVPKVSVAVGVAAPAVVASHAAITDIETSERDRLMKSNRALDMWRYLFPSWN